MMPPARHYRILHTEVSLGWGGQEIRVFTEMEAMRKRGHHLALASPVQSAIYGRCREAGFLVVPLPDSRIRFAGNCWRLRRCLRKERFDVINMHSSRDGWIGGIAGRWAGTPCIIRSRHIEVDYPNRVVSRRVFGDLPHHVITTSDRITRRLINELELDPDRVETVRTGIDLERFRPGLGSGLRGELGVGGGVFLIGMVAVLRSWKGHRILLQALHQLVSRGVDIRLVLAGDGPIREWIVEEIRHLHLADRVHLLGHRADVPEILAALDVVVLASTAHEGIPQMILQAQACGRCVVGTRVGGIPEVVRDGETGYLVDPSEPKALAMTLDWLREHPELRDRTGGAARRQAEAEHGLDRMCEKLERIYARHVPA